MRGDDPDIGKGGLGNVDPEALNFRYNRERRIEHAPEIVRNTYARGYTPNKGFIKGLTANAGLKSVFFTIILLSVVVVGLSVFADNPDTGRFPGAKARMKAFLYNDTVYVSISFEAEGPSGETEPVEITASIDGLDSGGNTVTGQTVSGVWAGGNYALRTPLRDYELTKVRASVRFGKTEAELVASVDRN